MTKLSERDSVTRFRSDCTRLAQSCALVASLILLSACSSSNDDTPETDIPENDTPLTELPNTENPDTNTPVTETPDIETPQETGDPPVTETSSNGGQYAYVATRAADYGSGRIDRISLDDGNVVDGSYPATLSDIAVDSDGQQPYQIGRFLIDSITRYDARDTSATNYQYSVNGDESASANPQDIAFLSPDKAYLTRRGSDKLWIINPGATSELEFKLGELDLGAYDTDMPDMTDAIIVNGKLFVIVERLLELPSFSQVPDKAAYLAVFDTSTDSEIDTGKGSDGLKGIELLVTNPTSLQYNEATGEIYVVGRGNFFEGDAITDDFHSGGVVALDPESYEQTLLLDDGTDEDNQGYFVELDVIDAQNAYLLTYTAFGVTTLRTFNPTTGLLNDDVLTALQDVDLTTMAAGPDRHLWVGINDDTPGFYRIDLDTGELAADRVTTELVPTDIEFIDVAPQ